MSDDPTNPTAGARRQRAVWRSRRGMLELELLLQPFVQDAFGDLPPPAQDAYERLLEFDDWDLFEWLQGRAPPPQIVADGELAAILDRIRQFHGGPPGA